MVDHCAGADGGEVLEGLVLQVLENVRVQGNGGERCHGQHRTIGRCALEQVQRNLSASARAAVDDALVLAEGRAGKLFGHTARADVSCAARREAVEHLDLLNGQTALGPGLPEGGTAEDGRAGGGLDELTTVAHDVSWVLVEKMVG